MALKVSLQPSGENFEGYPDETLLTSALEAGVHMPYGCRSGTCGACKCRLVAGRVDPGQDGALTQDERARGLILACRATPLSDVTLECRQPGAERDSPARIMPARVERIERVAPDVVVMALKLPANERLQFLAGQYVEVLLEGGRRRAFSIANAPRGGDFIELHIRRVAGGLFTERVFDRMKEKDILRIEGPRGAFRLQEGSAKPIVFVAGGTGFAPVKAIVEHAIDHRIARPMTVYWGARTRAGLYLPELPAQWAAHHPHIRYVPVLSEPETGDGWDGRTGLVHRAVLEDHADLSGHQAYVCGAPAMVDAARRDFCAQGLPAEEFFADAFTFASP
jgi:CDP-4-dehydro-6-deoxyglucose reductase